MAVAIASGVRTPMQTLSTNSRFLNVVRTLLVGAFAVGATACIGGAPIGGDSEPDAMSADLTEEELARQEFEVNVAPLLTSYCGSCHDTDTSVPFMDNGTGSTMYASIMGWPGLISLRVPSASSLLSKGDHAGPGWQPSQADIVRDWIAGEARLLPENEGLETAPFIPVAGDNTIDLAPIGLPGASLSFFMDPLSSGMYLSQVSLNAAAEGVHIVHPTFVPWEGDTPAPDPVDRFSNVDLYAPATESVFVGGGTLILVGVDSAAPISVRFETAEIASQGETVLDGCKDVASFTANAQPQLDQFCTSCHGGGVAGATAATDMTKIDDLSAEGQLAACGQILSRVNLMDANNSSIFLAAEPGGAASHSYKLPNTNAFNTFRSSLLTWITAEQNASL